ncbi:MAG: type II and III secretion system protein family protein [Gammaproteobacteria bacterium]
MFYTSREELFIARNLTKYRLSILCFLLSGVFINLVDVMAQPVLENSFLVKNTNGSIEVALHKSGIIPLRQKAKQVSVGNPEIADILIFESKQLYVVGKAPGTTNVVVWNNKDQVFDSFNVEVTHDLEALKYKLYQLLPDETIKVNSSQQKLVLSGEVSNILKMNAAIELARSFAPNCGSQGGDSNSCIINLMQVGGAQQVMLQIKVAEISRSVLKSLDGQTQILNFGNTVQAGAVSGGGTVGGSLGGPVIGNIDDIGLLGPDLREFTPSTSAIGDTGVLLSYLTGDFLLQSVLEASRQKGLAKILAEPVVTTMTGQQAEFLSGGEFPIPVSQDLGQVTIEFKEFGVGVKFLPVVLDSGRINLKLNIAVTELSSEVPVLLNITGSASSFSIPSLTKRSTMSTVELGNGQTMGIAGLISDNVRESVDKFPGLGDVPLLGALFRSQEFRSGQTELVIFVTPHLAKPISPSRVVLPTDSFVPANDTDFFIRGRMEAPTSSLNEKQKNTHGGMIGDFGHDLQGE